MEDITVEHNFGSVDPKDYYKFDQISPVHSGED
jgi:hypothetical protein